MNSGFKNALESKIKSERRINNEYDFSKYLFLTNLTFDNMLVIALLWILYIIKKSYCLLKMRLNISDSNIENIKKTGVIIDYRSIIYRMANKGLNSFNSCVKEEEVGRIRIFNNVLSKFILVFIVICILFSFFYGLLYNANISIAAIIILFVLVISCIVFRKKYKLFYVYCDIKKLDIKYILLIALLLRFIWVLLIPTKPFSDFGVMYNYAKDAALGKFYGFYGIGYFARFAHDSITVLYFSLFYHISSNPLIIVKLLNVVFQTAAVYYMYKLVLQLTKNDASAKVSAFLLAIFPPFVIFVSQTMSENMAIPFYIASVFYFFKGIASEGKKSIKFYILCGLLLSAANMFRMIGTVVLIAYAMYLLLYEGLKKFLLKYPVIILSFGVLFFIVSQSLVSSGVLETQLWNSKEPAITSILKGTNIEHHGAYNDEDAALPIKLNYDSAAIKKEASKIIIKRLTTTPPLKLAAFYVQKLALQWGCSDYGAVNWTVTADDNSIISTIIKKNMLIVNLIIALIYCFILARAAISIIKSKNGLQKEMYFFYIAMTGFILLYLLTEMQPRYAFIAAWIFIVLGTGKNEEADFC